MRRFRFHVDPKERDLHLKALEERIEAQRRSTLPKGAKNVEGQGILQDIDQARQKGYLDVSTPHNGAVFYDNGRVTLDQPDPKRADRRQVVSNRDRANEFCGKPGNEHCRTVEMTQGGQWLEQQRLYQGVLTNKQADRVWANTSRDFAKSASGEPNAFVRADSAGHRNFAKIEKPALQHNRDVTAIHYHHNERGMLLHHRQATQADPGMKRGELLNKMRDKADGMGKDAGMGKGRD